MFGSFIALTYALRYQDRLDGLILCSGAPALDYPDVIAANFAARATPEQLEVFARRMGASGAGAARGLAKIPPGWNGCPLRAHSLSQGAIDRLP
jgi:pimeloyl-ACP methyl ester carboxylesterase